MRYLVGCTFCTMQSTPCIRFPYAFDSICRISAVRGGRDECWPLLLLRCIVLWHCLRSWSALLWCAHAILWVVASWCAFMSVSLGLCFGGMGGCGASSSYTYHEGGCSLLLSHGGRTTGIDVSSL